MGNFDDDIWIEGSYLYHRNKFSNEVKRNVLGESLFPHTVLPDFHANESKEDRKKRKIKEWLDAKEDWENNHGPFSEGMKKFIKDYEDESGIGSEND